MQSDDLVWKLISKGHCKYKASALTTTFCRSKYNLTGLCNRSSCPLANSKFATVLEEEGRLYLCIKEVERVHTPKDTWQKILLPRNYTLALQEVDEHLAYWKPFIRHKCKQRVTRLTQVLMRMRKLALSVQPKLVRINKKSARRDKVREEKALRAAVVERAIEKELLSRLHANVYPDSEQILNASPGLFNKALDKSKASPDKLSKEVAQDEDLQLGATREQELETHDDQELLAPDEEAVVREFIEDLELDFSFLQDVEDVPYAAEAGEGSSAGPAAGIGSSSEFFQAIMAKKDKKDKKDKKRKAQAKAGKRDRKKPRSKRVELEIEREREVEEISPRRTRSSRR